MRDGGAWRQKCGGGDREQSQGLKKEGEQGQRCRGPGGRTPRDRANHLWAENHKAGGEGLWAGSGRGRGGNGEREGNHGRESETRLWTRGRDRSGKATKPKPNGRTGGRRQGAALAGLSRAPPRPPSRAGRRSPHMAPCFQGHTEGRGPGLCRTRHVCLLGTQQ